LFGPLSVCCFEIVCGEIVTNGEAEALSSSQKMAGPGVRLKKPRRAATKPKKGD
jgi:hypothetical protein